jgi:hypothetical protein
MKSSSVQGNRPSTPEWQLVNSGTRMARPLRGTELIVKHSEHHFDGNVSRYLINEYLVERGNFN